MSQLKMSLAGVLAILSALAFGFVCFLGANFYTEGNTKQSIITAAIITLLLIAFALGLKRLKQASRNFKTFFVFEIITLVLLTGVFFVCTWFVFSHYFVVTEKKTEIQNTLTASINEAQGMFSAYESYVENRLNLYESTLNNVVTNEVTKPQQYVAFGFVKGVDNNIQINKKMDDLRIQLYPSNYSDTHSSTGIKEVADKWLADARKNVNSWKPIGVVNVTNEIAKNSHQWLDTLLDFSKVRPYNEVASDFLYTLSFNSVKQQFTTQEKPPLISLGFAIFSYLLMLLPWAITKRDSRGKGATQTKEYEVVL